MSHESGSFKYDTEIGASGEKYEIRWGDRKGSWKYSTW